MALTDKLTAIADAIREKAHLTNKLTLDAMPTAIRTISGGGGGGTAVTISFFSTLTVVFTYTTVNGTLSTVSLSKRNTSATVTDAMEGTLLCCGNLMGSAAYLISSDAMIPSSLVTPYTHKVVGGTTYTAEAN